MLILSLYSSAYPTPVYTIHSAVDNSINVQSSGLQMPAGYDIGLLRLKEPFPLIKGKTAALRPAGQNATKKPESCVAVGWGRKRHFEQNAKYPSQTIARWVPKALKTAFLTCLGHFWPFGPPRPSNLPTYWESLFGLQ